MAIEAGDVDAEEIGDDEVYEAVETDDAIAMDK